MKNSHINEEESGIDCMFVLNLMGPLWINILYHLSYCEPPVWEGVSPGVQTESSPKLKECLGLYWWGENIKCGLGRAVSVTYS